MPEIFVSSEDKPQKQEPQDASRKLFSAFNFHPKNIDFETKEKEEKVILMLRQHPIVNIKWIFITIILLICPILFQKTGILTLLPSGYPLVVNMVWYLVTFAYAIEGFFGWYFNVFFITTRRIIDVDFFNLIDKRVSDAEIEKIQDVSYSTSGPIGTALNFGNIAIQTSSEMRELLFERVPRPERAVEILDGLRANVH